MGDSKMVKTIPEDDFALDFTLTTLLGNGHFGSVYKCIEKKTGDAYAVKELELADMNEDDVRKAEEEMEICKLLHHRNIVELFHCYRSETLYRLVLELVPGGELFDALIARTSYSELDACNCTYQVLLALEHCHHHRIIHRDLKPENLLLTAKPAQSDSLEGVRIKLADFGLAKRLPEGQEYILTDTAGTAMYVAPETLRRQPVNGGVDMWAMGVVMFILLVGQPPFWPGEKGNNEMFAKIVNGCYSFDAVEWESISEKMKQLATRMLTVDQTKRITASEAVDEIEPFVRLREPSECHRRNTLDRMKAFRTKSFLKEKLLHRLRHRGEGTVGVRVLAVGEVSSEDDNEPMRPRLGSMVSATVTSATAKQVRRTKTISNPAGSGLRRTWSFNKQLHSKNSK